MTRLCGRVPSVRFRSSYVPLERSRLARKRHAIGAAPSTTIPPQARDEPSKVARPGVGRPPFAEMASLCG